MTAIVHDAAPAGPFGEVTSVRSRKSDERAATATGLKLRALFFHEFLNIGSGWNMYYSAAPSIALPVRTYNSSKHLLPQVFDGMHQGLILTIGKS